MEERRKKSLKKGEDVMKCPECGGEMEEGYIGVMTRSALFWSKDEPESARLSMPKGSTMLLRNQGWFPDKKDWLRKGFRCPNCKIVIFSYREREEVDRGFSEAPRT